jgi:hypothetical protein
MKKFFTILVVSALVVGGVFVVSMLGLRIPQSTQERMVTLMTRKNETVGMMGLARGRLTPAEMVTLEQLYESAKRPTNEFVEAFTLQVEDSVFYLNASLLDRRADQALEAHVAFAEYFDRAIRHQLVERGDRLPRFEVAAREIANDFAPGTEVAKFWVAEQQRRRQAFKDYVEKLRMH